MPRLNLDYKIVGSLRWKAFLGFGLKNLHFLMDPFMYRIGCMLHPLQTNSSMSVHHECSKEDIDSASDDTLDHVDEHGNRVPFAQKSYTFKSGFLKSFYQMSSYGGLLAEEKQETTFNVSPGENKDTVRENSPTEAEKSGDDNESKVVDSPRTKAQISQEFEMKKRIEALRFELKLLEDSFTRSTDQSGQKLPITLEAEINNKWDFVATPAEDQREKYSDEIADTERCIS
jgi:hypothetical protein